MNTTQLECFVNIASTLNFMKTAQLMSLTQPAVSKQIQSLEKELGARLFERTTRSISLTRVGAKFLPEAKDMLKTYYHSKSWISAYGDSEQSYLRIGYADPHDINCISKTFALLLEDYKNVSPRFTIDQTDANLARLERGQLDMVIGIKDYSYKNKDIVFVEMMTDRFTCIVNNDHPLARTAQTDTVITDDFWEYSQVIAIPSYLLVNNFINKHPILPVNEKVTNYNCSNNAEAYGMVLAGFGFSMIPTHLLMPHPNLRFFKWKTTPTTPMGIYYAKGSSNDNQIILSYLKKARMAYAAGVTSQI